MFFVIRSKEKRENSIKKIKINFIGAVTDIYWKIIEAPINIV